MKSEVRKMCILLYFRLGMKAGCEDESIGVHCQRVVESPRPSPLVALVRTLEEKLGESVRQ